MWSPGHSLTSPPWSMRDTKRAHPSPSPMQHRGGVRRFVEAPNEKHWRHCGAGENTVKMRRKIEKKHRTLPCEGEERCLNSLDTWKPSICAIMSCLLVHDMCGFTSAGRSWYRPQYDDDNTWVACGGVTQPTECGVRVI